MYYTESLGALLTKTRPKPVPLVADFAADDRLDWIVRRMCTLADEARDLDLAAHDLSNELLTTRGVEAREDELREHLARHGPALVKYLEPFAGIEHSKITTSTHYNDIYRLCVWEILATR